MQETLGLAGFLMRLGAALGLVLLTYNPSGRSFYHWAAHVFPGVTPAIALAAVTLLIAWVVFLRATLRSIGAAGLLLGGAFIATVVWFATDRGWLEIASMRALTWIVLVGLALILAVGVSWSHVRRRLTGQADVDEKDV